MLIDLLILIVCCTASSLLGMVIFTRNPSLGNNRRFAFLSLSLVSWTLFNYLSDNANSHNLIYTRLTFFGGVAAGYSILLFISNFPITTTFKSKIYFRLNKLYALALIPIIFSPYFISSVSDTEVNGTITTGKLYPLFLLYAVYAVVLIAVSIVWQTRHSKTFVEKQQVSVISWGIIGYVVLAVSSNILLPLVINDWSSSRFGPVFTLFLVGMVAYTIAKHRLFDIRLVVVRSLGYILSLTTIAGVSFFGLTYLTSFFDKANVSEEIRRAVFVSLTLILAISYQPFKSLFDKLTNKIFYKDAYDPQQLLDGLNKTLISTIEIKSLSYWVSEIIAESLKAEFCILEIKQVGTRIDHIVGSQKKVSINLTDVENIQKLASGLHQKIIVTDELETGKEALIKLLRDNNIAVLARLTNDPNRTAGGLGYLILGNKKSGNPYSSQDKQILEIIADELVIAVQNALRFEEIQNFNLTLQEKVDNATRQLRRTNEKLKQLDETKDDFISMASHQLRTPLTSVKGYVSMVLDGDAGKITAQQKKLLDQAFTSSQRMVYLIADLLNVSRLKTGKFIIQPVLTNLADVVESEMMQLTETAKGRNLELAYVKPKNFPQLMLDETKVRQVIMNFADNAIYYTPAGGHIRIELEDTPHTIEYRVVDDGIGVPKNEQHHLFGKFYRAGNAKKARPDGTGLGLFMAQKVIVAQGGAVIFNSQEGKGSTFGFSFPKAKLLPTAIHTGPKEVTTTKE
jgi:signal transduction histidine kinase